MFKLFLLCTGTFFQKHKLRKVRKQQEEDYSNSSHQRRLSQVTKELQVSAAPIAVLGSGSIGSVISGPPGSGPVILNYCFIEDSMKSSEKFNICILFNDYCRTSLITYFFNSRKNVQVGSKSRSISGRSVVILASRIRITHYLLIRILNKYLRIRNAVPCLLSTTGLRSR
jgi:hypothetical protein